MTFIPPAPSPASQSSQARFRPPAKFPSRYARDGLISAAISLVLTAGTYMFPDGDPMVIGIISAVGFVLLLVGFAMVLVALVGWFMYRQEGVLSLALGGLCIVLLVVGIRAYTIIENRNAAVAKAIQLERNAYIQAVNDSVVLSGWAGPFSESGKSMAILSVPDDSPLTKLVRSQIPGDYSIMIISAENRSMNDMVIAAQKARLSFRSGKTAEALDWRQFLPSSSSQSISERDLSWPLTVSSGSTADGHLLFVPPNLDMNDLESIETWSDGAPRVVKGQWATGDQKRRRMQNPFRR